MVSNMKTTVDIPDDLLAAAKRVARDEGTTLRALLADGLRWAIRRHRKPAAYRLEDRTVGGRGTQPGVSEGDWDAIRDLIYRESGS